MASSHMGRFWDARAREEPYFFIDNRRAYGDPDLATFWSDGERDLDRILELLGVVVRPDAVALDIGCGIGRLTRVLAARGAEAIGLDVSSVMLEQAAVHHAEVPNIRWVLGDGISLRPLADASVDHAVSHVVFQHIPDPAITLGYVRELGRVLRPGGWAAFQISNDPAVHVARAAGVRERLATAARRRPRGQDDSAWLGSAVAMPELRATADAAGLALERVVGEGTQFCLVLARQGLPGTPEAGSGRRPPMM